MGILRCAQDDKVEVVSVLDCFARFRTVGVARVRRAWRDCGAAEIAEAALVLPVLFALIIAIFQFARVYVIYSTMQRAALEGAQMAASSTCATCGNSSTIATVVAGMQPVFNIAHIDYAPITLPTSVPPLRACTLPTLIPSPLTSA